MHEDIRKRIREYKLSPRVLHRADSRSITEAVRPEITS